MSSPKYTILADDFFILGDDVYSEECRRPNILSWPTIFFILGDDIYSEECRRPSRLLADDFLKKAGDDFEIVGQDTLGRRFLKKAGDDFYKIVAQERHYKRQKFGNPNHFFSRQAYSLPLSENPLSALSLSLSPTPTPTPIPIPDPDVDPQFKV
ncbi:hypothetical protein ACLB2K_047304 [Fragaria x ananassa]